MDGKLQTSFIPKQSLVENKAKKAPMSTNLFAVVGWIFFLLAVAASAGVFFYEQYLTKTIEIKNTELKTRMDSFGPSSENRVDQIVQLDARLQAASAILTNHTAISALMGLISSNTIQSIQFTDIKYNYDDAGKITLVLGGKAPNFASVALQSDRFSAQSYFHNQVFSNLGLDLDGGVLFKFNATIDQSELQYDKVTN